MIVGGGLDQVLAVVDHQQTAASAQQVEQPFRVVLAGLGPVLQLPVRPAARGRRGRPPAMLAGSVTGASSISQADRRSSASQRAGHLGGQPGLAGAARTDHRGQPLRPHRGQHPVDVGLPTDEAGQPRPQVAATSGAG